MKVDLLDSNDSDLTVVNCARVSFDKWHDEFKDNDVGLINYLAKHNHFRPFAHPHVRFRIEAPIFVARQLKTHEVGLVWNEVSRRYVDKEPEFFVPDYWRKKADNKKQGSTDEAISVVDKRLYGDVTAEQKYERFLDHAVDCYRSFLEAGICPEQARMILPQSMYTSWIWTGSLYAFARIVKLRTHDDAQRETRVIAEMIAEHMAKAFPVSWKALMEN